MKRVNTVRYVTTLLALLLSCLLAVAIPAGYLVMLYEHQTAVLETEAESTAFAVSQLISANPEYWRFEQPRLEGFLSQQRPADQQAESRRIVDTDRVVLAQTAEGLESPVITRSHALYDSGKIVAQLEISRSLRPFLVNALIIGCIGLGFGAVSFLLLRVFPLRALDGGLKSLQESEDKFSAIAATATDAIIVMDPHGYSIVSRHGGYISVESEPGRGAVFYVYLPALRQPLPLRETQGKARMNGAGRILVMDDEELVRTIAGEMLQALGYEPAFARDGEEALALYRDASAAGALFDAVIMDLTVPGGMGGKDAVRKLLATDPWARVIVASGYSNDPVLAEFRSHGFKGMIAKPFTQEVFSSTLTEVLEG